MRYGKHSWECDDSPQSARERRDDIDSNKITEIIIGAAIDVHELGPGLLESTYEACLAYELIERGLKLERQKILPVKYREFIWIAVIGLTCWQRTW